MQTQTIPEKVSGSGEQRDMTACKGLETWVMFAAVMVGCECAGHGLSTEDSWARRDFGSGKPLQADSRQSWLRCDLS